ncbi:MAG: glycosyltransferase family 2 protein [Candidatus Omnitrophota bacterium]
MLNKGLSVILPVYNEEGNISQVISRALEILPSITCDFEIIIVDDGSLDKTGNILERLRACDARLKVLRHSRNLGYGAALRSGFKSAQKQLIFMMDADRQFDISDIAGLAAYIEDYDIVVGCRKKRRDPIYRSFFSHCFNSIGKFCFGIKFQDINCGFKLFKRESLQGMALFSTGSIISAEILTKAGINKLKIKQVVVNHYPRIHGRQTGASLKVIFTILWEMGKLKMQITKSPLR